MGLLVVTTDQHTIGSAKQITNNCLRVGWASAYYEIDVGGLWDVCAGIVIVKEAGGVVLHPADGSDVVPCASGKQRVICGNAALVDAIRRQQGLAAGGAASAGASPATKKRKN